VHKRYEFGCKTSVVSTSRDNWILDIEALHGNPYDGHTLKRALANAEINSGYKVTHAFCDKGYKGAGKELERVELYLSGARHLSRAFRRWLKRRAAIEPVIGHLKSEHRMGRNHLAGVQGDRINAILAACGFNLRKLYRAIARCFFVLLALIRCLGLRKRPRELLEPSIC
jgi:IS5 family transposase